MNYDERPKSSARNNPYFIKDAAKIMKTQSNLNSKKLLNKFTNKGGAELPMTLKGKMRPQNEEYPSPSDYSVGCELLESELN